MIKNREVDEIQKFLFPTKESLLGENDSKGPRRKDVDRGHLGFKYQR